MALVMLSFLVAWWLSALVASLMCLYAGIRLKREVQRNRSSQVWFWCATLLSLTWFFLGAWSLYTDVFPPKSVPLLK
jgi:cytochrome bd-type quinol oxidase subunit 2